MKGGSVEKSAAGPSSASTNEVGRKKTKKVAIADII